MERPKDSGFKKEPSMNLRRIIANYHRLASLPGQVAQIASQISILRQAVGRIEGRQTQAASSLGEAEFQVYSQWGEDGILQYLVKNVAVPVRIFVEFGVESYVEANTRWLLVNDNWSGLVIDGDPANIEAVRRDPVYWRHHLKAAAAFITAENINELLEANGLQGEIGLLSIDVDGVDYWIWKNITVIRPAIVVAEYNSLFGADRAVTVPYDPGFQRKKAHHSMSYYGASLAALVSLGQEKGYAFVGSNSAGSNAFFVRTDLMRAPLRELTVAEGYVQRRFREARDAAGRQIFPSFNEEAALIAELPLVEVPHPGGQS